MDEGVRDLDSVVVLIVFLDAKEDLIGVLDGRFVDFDGLEAALQSGILLDVPTVFVERRGTDDLDLTAGQSGFHDVRGIHVAFGIARAHEVVDLVDEEDDVALRLDFVDEPLHTAFELTAELGARHESGEVQKVDLLVGEFRRHFPVRDAFREPFGDGGLTDAGFTDETGVVLRTSAEDLDGAVDLLVSADDVVEFPIAGSRSQVGAVEAEEPALLVFALVAVLPTAAGPGLCVRLRCLRFLRDEVHRLRILELVRHIRVSECAKERLQRRHRRGPTLFEVVIGVETEHGVHLFGDGVHVVGGNAHVVHEVLHGTDVHFHGAFDAVAFRLVLRVVHFRDEDDCGVFLAF